MNIEGERRHRSYRKMILMCYGGYKWEIRKMIGERQLFLLAQEWD